jgi:hypothetical protein
MTASKSSELELTLQRRIQDGMPFGVAGHPRKPPGINGAICASRSDHGTTWSTTPRSSRRRERFVEVPNPRLLCFEGSMVSGSQAGTKHIHGRMMRNTLGSKDGSSPTYLQQSGVHRIV